MKVLTGIEETSVVILCIDDDMAKHKKLSPQFQAWVDARKRFQLSHAQVQMARELEMNPKKLGGKANHRQEPSKLPLPQYIVSQAVQEGAA